MDAIYITEPEICTFQELSENVDNLCIVSYNNNVDVKNVL